MWSKKKSRWIPSMLVIFLIAGMLAGCEDKRHEATDVDSNPQGIELKIIEASGSQSKMTGLTVQATGLDDANRPVGPTVGPISIPNPVFPVSVPMTLNEPPCRYQITATATLSQQGSQTASGILDICQSSGLSLRLDDFEPFSIKRNPITVSSMAAAGDALEATCATPFFDAPEGDMFPLSATLYEVDGKTISGPFDFAEPLIGTFPDPYPLSSPVSNRVFRCIVFDGRSNPQTFQKVVTRTNPSGSADAVPTPEPSIEPSELTTVFVNSNGGTDSATCGQEGFPCKTIFQGIQVASKSLVSHVTIHVASGTYRSPDIKVSGSFNKNLSFKAESNVTLRGGGLTIKANTTIKMTGFTFYESYIHAESDSGTVVLEDNRFTTNLHTPIGSFHGGVNITLQDNTVNAAGTNVFSLVTRGMVIMEDNVFTTQDIRQTGSPALILGRGSGLTILNGNTVTVPESTPETGQAIECHSGTFVTNRNNTTNGNITGCDTQDLICSSAQCTF